MRSSKIPVGALGLVLAALELAENLLDAVDGRENQRDGLRGDCDAVTKPAHQRLRRMGERLQPRQPEEPAGSLDGVDEAEDVVEDLGVVGILLETDQLDVDQVEALVGLGQEFTQQLVHANAPGRGATRVARPTPFASGASLLGNGLRLVARAPA